jgi:hypothetical protein
MYRGNNVESRREQIGQWSDPPFKLIEADPKAGWHRAIESVPAETEICVLWSDDDKPIGRDFLRQMMLPLTSGAGFGASMHFWSGNAVSVLKSLLDDARIKESENGTQSLLKLLVPMLAATEKGPSGRVHLALSSTEKLAPMTVEPVGYPC